MIRLLQFLIFGHVHKWVEDCRNPLTRGGSTTGQIVFTHCEKCGAQKCWALRP